MTLVEDVARLKELECVSRQLLCDRQEYAEKMASTAPVLLEVLDFRDGDAMILGCLLEIMKFYHPDGHLDDRGDGAKITNRQAADCLRRLVCMAHKMEANGMKHWEVSKTYVCTIMGEICGNAVCRYHDSLAPDCDGCNILKEWKKSGMTKYEFRKTQEHRP